MRVTFDTNVWNRMVFPERHVNNPNYLSLGQIKNAIRSGQVRGFISEGFGTVEAVRRENRAKFHAQNVPKVEVTNKSHGNGLNCMTIEIKANHSLHPGIGEEFDEELNEALAIGIELLTTPYIGLPVPDRLRNNPHIYAEEVFATADYNERFGDVVRTIVDRGVGEGCFWLSRKSLLRAWMVHGRTDYQIAPSSTAFMNTRAHQGSARKRGKSRRHLRNQPMAT